MVRRGNIGRRDGMVPSGVCRSNANKSLVLVARSVVWLVKIFCTVAHRGGFRNKCGGGLTDKGKLV
jgi:hypothetical protein